jgi:Flp pilus assembly protein TadG
MTTIDTKPGDTKSSPRGSALVEFALVLTVLFTVIFGIMDFSRAMYAYHFVSEAARDATRYASVRGSSCKSATVTPCPAAASDITTFVYGTIAAGLAVTSTAGGATTCPATNPSTPYTLAVCASWPGAAETGTLAGSCVTTNGVNSPGCPVKVTVQYVFGFSLPFVSSKVSSMDLTSTSEVVISR